MELEVLKSIITKELENYAEDVTVDDEILHSIYSWDRMKLEGITIGSSSSGFSDLSGELLHPDPASESTEKQALSI